MPPRRVEDAGNVQSTASQRHPLKLRKDGGDVLVVARTHLLFSAVYKSRRMGAIHMSQWPSQSPIFKKSHMIFRPN